MRSKLLPKKIICLSLLSIAIGSSTTLQAQSNAAAFLPGEKTVSKSHSIATLSNGWARATIEGQAVTGGFLSITAHETLSFVKASSPAAKSTELHEMRMEGDKMIMREIKKLEIKKGETLDLKPGSYHLMFIDLKEPLTEGNKIPVTLTFKVKGKLRSLKTELQVKAITTP